MRRHYLDNIRWITVGLVVLYHVIFMYNGVVTAGGIGPFWEIQYQDAVQYLLYPWFMVLLFRMLLLLAFIDPRRQLRIAEHIHHAVVTDAVSAAEILVCVVVKHTPPKTSKVLV